MTEDSPAPNRRGFLSNISLGAMFAGLVAGYGALAAMAARFLYPADPPAVAWRYVTTLAQMKVGDAMTFVAPTGDTIVVARQGEGESEEDFVALSSICPHLGCQVHWEPQNDRFFCPCHNGVFDPQGKPVEGPPAQANQLLTSFPLKVENGLLYMEVPMESVAEGRNGTV